METGKIASGPLAVLLIPFLRIYVFENYLFLDCNMNVVVIVMKPNVNVHLNVGLVAEDCALPVYSSLPLFVSAELNKLLLTAHGIWKLSITDFTPVTLFRILRYILLSSKNKGKCEYFCSVSKRLLKHGLTNLCH